MVMPRHPTTATGSLRITETYRDHTRTARRAHVHGPIRSLREDARAMGEPSWLAGTALVIACLLAVLGAVLVLHALIGG